MSAATAEATPRIWIGSLSAYNAGDLLGDWFDAADAPTDADEWVEQMLALGHFSRLARPVSEAASKGLAEEHEEIWVFDHEGFEGLKSGEGSPAEFQEAAQLLSNLDEDEAPAFRLWFDNEERDTTDPDALIEKFREEWAGEWDSVTEYAGNLVEDMGLLEQVPESLRYYIDFEKYARDLEIGGDIWTAWADGGRTHVFHNR